MSVNYDFVHRELRDFAFKDPATLLAMLSDAAGLEALARVWNQMVEADGKANRVSGRDFASTPRSLPDGTPLAILKLPKAEAICEVILAGIVGGPKPRFFTLEVTMSGGNVFCEWKRDEKGFRHVNYGDEIIPAEPEPFAGLILQALGRESL